MYTCATNPHETAEAIDLDFLWECAPEDEFAFDSLAGEYFGGEPDSVQSAALLIKLKSAPIYFQRKGRGRFKAAPQEKVQQALAGLAKRAEQEALIESLANEMIGGTLPDSLLSNRFTAELSLAMLLTNGRLTTKRLSVLARYR